jgi:quercetin dioxygenase-like cupin family protein
MEVDAMSGVPFAGLPEDDPGRGLVVARPETDQTLPHIGIVGDTYTILLSGADTAGRYCLIDMFVPPGGGPGPHRHDFEETFVLLEGELEVTFRGVTATARAGETVHVPANAPHMFHNASLKAVRMLCICSPAGQEGFFRELGVAVGSRTAAPAKLDAAGMAGFRAAAGRLAGKYKTELLGGA